jgi:hypothetical protein
MTIVNVDVEVDMCDFDTQELIDELNSRQDGPSIAAAPIQLMYEALLLGKNDQALTMLRTYITDATGKCLP